MCIDYKCLHMENFSHTLKSIEARCNPVYNSGYEHVFEFRGLSYLDDDYNICLEPQFLSSFCKCGNYTDLDNIWWYDDSHYAVCRCASKKEFLNEREIIDIRCRDCNCLPIVIYCKYKEDGKDDKKGELLGDLSGFHFNGYLCNHCYNIKMEDLDEIKTMIEETMRPPNQGRSL